MESDQENVWGDIMPELTHLSLFSGIGGADLATEWAGFTTVGQCEWADYPTKVLEKHWPDVPRWKDIKTLTKESFYGETGLRTVDLVSGGFPCQPFSVAGKRKGKEDDRYLWPEMLRVIKEIRPAWVVGENVVGIINMELDTTLSDLESIGYTCQTFVIPACAVDAPHRRDRIAVVANRLCNRSKTRFADSEKREKRKSNQSFYGGKNVANPESRWKQREKQIRSKTRRSCSYCEWPAEPDVGRVAHGVPHRVDRLKCLGNAIVPQQFYPIFKAIADIETGNII